MRVRLNPEPQTLNPEPSNKNRRPGNHAGAAESFASQKNAD
jgi:hypothetical protein